MSAPDDGLAMLRAIASSLDTAAGRREARRIVATLRAVATEADHDDGDAGLTEAERAFAEALRRGRERAAGQRPVVRRGPRRRADGGEQ